MGGPSTLSGTVTFSPSALFTAVVSVGRRGSHPAVDHLQVIVDVFTPVTRRAAVAASRYCG